MNYLVFLNAHAGELEKILSGMKTMLIKEFYPAQITSHPVNPGDSLYFLREQDDCALRVRATVIRVIPVMNSLYEDVSQPLKEMQPRLQLTEDQFNYWSAKGQMVLVEFESAQKIVVIQVAPERITDRLGWIAFEDFNQISE